MKKVVLLFFAALAAFASFGFAPAAAGAEEALVSGCKAAYLCDWRSGTEVYGKGELEHLPIASMCKIMTLVLCFDEIENGGLAADEQITVSETASGMGGSQVFLETGGVYPAGELIKSICIASANDSCVAMAERIAGSEALFVKKMNARAKELQMDNTEFVNCTGLPESGQYSCAKDVAAMLSELLRHEEYFHYSKIWMDDMHHKGGRVTEMANTNKLIRSYQGCDAGKTGYTSEAGFCLAASAMRGNMRVISVIIGASDSKTRFNNSKTLFDYAFANYTNKAVLEERVLDDAFCTVKGGKQKEISVIPERASYIFCSKGDTDEIFYELNLDEVTAPVRRGDAVGTVTVYKNNIEADRLKLLANEDVEKSSYLDSLRDAARGWGFLNRGGQ